MQIKVYETPVNNKYGLMDFTIFCLLLDVLAEGTRVRDCYLDYSKTGRILVCENGYLYDNMYGDVLKARGEVIFDLIVEQNEEYINFDVAAINFKEYKEN